MDTQEAMAALDDLAGCLSATVLKGTYEYYGDDVDPAILERVVPLSVVALAMRLALSEPTWARALLAAASNDEAVEGENAKSFAQSVLAAYPIGGTE